MIFYAKQYISTNGDYNYSFNLTLILLNGLATLFSLIVDVIKYPMFIMIFKYFFKEHRKRYNFNSQYVGDSGNSDSFLQTSQTLPLKIKLWTAQVIFLFFLNLAHTLYTHFIRIWQISDIQTYIDHFNDNSIYQRRVLMYELLFLNFKDLVMGLTFTYLAYFLTVSSQPNYSKNGQLKEP